MSNNGAHRTLRIVSIYIIEKPTNIRFHSIWKF